MQGKFIDESTYKTAQATFPLVPSSDEHRNFFQHQKNRRKNQTNTTPTNQDQKRNQNQERGRNRES